MLAYSTLSQIAVMASALAFVLGPDEAPRLALGHLFSHALFKSLLFLAVGWLSVLAGGTAFVALRGRARGRGALYWSLAVGLASLAGLPPLVGFFSKEGVLFAAEESLSGHDAGLAWFVLLALVVTAGLTAAYCTRAWLLLTTERKGGLVELEAEEGQDESSEEAAPAGDEAATGAHEARPVTMAAALTVSALAVLTVVGGLLLIPVSNGIHLGLVMTVVSLLVIGAGVPRGPRDGRGRPRPGPPGSARPSPTSVTGGSGSTRSTSRPAARSSPSPGSSCGSTGTSSTPTRGVRRP